MYEIIKNVIQSKRYELADILKKIDTMWLQGSITDAQRDELSDLARSNADAGNSIDIMAKLEDHDKRLKALEENAATEPVEEYPVYAAGKWYYSGDKISFDEKNYTCIAPEGQVCTWSPAEYPAYWQLVE